MLLAIVFYVISRTSRWRPQWLAVPAESGLLWALAIGLPAALAGFTEGPSRVAGYLARTAHHPSNVFHLGEVFGGLGHWLPRQLPLALIAAAGEAAAAWWLRWLHTAEPDLPPPRPGLMILAGRQLRMSSVRAGGVVTREGACLGIVRGTGQRAAISWPEAEGGVLCTGSSEAAVAATQLPGGARGDPPPQAGHRGRPGRDTRAGRVAGGRVRGRRRAAAHLRAVRAGVLRAAARRRSGP